MTELAAKIDENDLLVVMRYSGKEEHLGDETVKAVYKMRPGRVEHF